jgi:hypothetical protein
VTLNGTEAQHKDRGDLVIIIPGSDQAKALDLSIRCFLSKVIKNYTFAFLAAATIGASLSSIYLEAVTTSRLLGLTT